MQEIIPRASLENWFVKRFLDNHPTIDLMSCAQNNHELAVIAIVAVMEVDPRIRYQGMDEEEVRYAKSCHNYILTLIKDPCVKKQRSTL